MNPREDIGVVMDIDRHQRFLSPTRLTGSFPPD
jgi:hypothetical protein